MPSKINIIGRTFGRLTPTSELKKRSKCGSLFYRCKCLCGSETEVVKRNILNGNTLSCGCLRREVLLKKNTIHGNSVRGKVTDEYNIWCDIKKRCENKSSESYLKYGAIGIKLCERWRVFKNFLEDMGSRPSKGHSIDRIDNSKGYSPNNCRWATRTEQNGNRKNCVYVHYMGEKITLSEFSRKIGIPKTTLHSKLNREDIKPQDLVAGLRWRTVCLLCNWKSAAPVNRADCVISRCPKCGYDCISDKAVFL